MIKKLTALGGLILLLSIGFWYSEHQLSQTRGSHWEESPVFSYFSMTLRGEEGRLAITDAPFNVKKQERYSWFFWTDPQSLFGKPFQVKGINWKSGQSHLLYEGEIGVPNRNIGGTARAARAFSTLALPTKGLWKLEAVVDGQQVGSIVVDVK
ncbi:DUF4871 domain-containing protein [Paenibacillus piri]|uniref:DUF4871 domain-containing protein n=1 Tax=Paenibacillus piri TaxID=2547395 RepID=A0A4R5KHX3_9BACL|nr:DUF4871 domain-containing protein [Paenibacillus piri]TDF93820.1 DUF4871 domain-containing protein [Paenibacillus piri]